MNLEKCEETEYLMPDAEGGTFVNLAEFRVDKDKCIGCGSCVKVCPGGILSLDGENRSRMKDIEGFGWNGCWKCEHCMAVCPMGAISIFGKKPEDSLLPVDTALSRKTMESLVMNRHSCRRYQNKDIPKEDILEMVELLGNAPNGGNKQLVEFTLFDDRKKMDEFRDLAYRRMEELAKSGVFADGFDASSYQDMKEWEKTVRPDMLFCSAPYLLIPHARTGHGEPVQDVNIAAAYFELICASRGYGAVIMTFPLANMKNMPDIREMLKIPDDHYIGSMIGFGIPEIRYVRGSQRKTENKRIHIL